MVGELEYDITVFALKVARGIGQSATGLAAFLSSAVSADAARVEQWVRIADAARV